MDGTGEDEVYVSTDVETDGPIPGPHSLLSLGSAAFRADGRMLATFSANLDALEGAAGHPAAMEWWQQNPDAWAASRENTRPPAEVMVEYAQWVKQLPGRPVFVAYPAGFDFTFVYWYLHRFAGESPFSHSALDIRTLAMALLKAPYGESSKRHMPRRWFPDSPHTHRALDDAIGQGQLFCNMLKELAGREPA
jgi:DNA polymerase III alpha subunit (gram-positive type)